MKNIITKIKNRQKNKIGHGLAFNIMTILMWVWALSLIFVFVWGIFVSFSDGVYYSVDMSRFFKNLMIAGSYSAIQYAMIIGGAVMLYKFIRSKKYKIRDYCEYRLPLDRAANIIIVNAGSIAFLVISVILFAYSVIM